MVRPTKWITAFTVGLALACEAPCLMAQEAPATEEAAAEALEPGDTQAADYTVEIPADAEDETAASEEQGEEAPSDEEAMSEESAEGDISDEMPEEMSDELTPEPAGEVDQDWPTPAKSLQHDAKPLPAASDAPESEIVKERFPNGSIKIERETTQDAEGNYVNHGSWKEFTQQGHPSAQGQYDHGQRTGTWIRWYRSVSDNALLTKPPYQQFPAPFISQATFHNDELDGTWTIFDGKMRKISQWNFAEGKRQGPSTWWYSNGRKMREINYRDGEIDGLLQEWAPDGTLRDQQTYQAGRKLGVKVTRHQKGGKKSEGTYLFAKEVIQTPDDWWQLKPATTTTAGRDERHGPWHSWYADGKNQQQGNYEHDVQVGKFTWWHPNGQMALEGSFADGKQDGQWTWWHANGQKSIRGEFAKGNPTGRWTWWKEDGRVAQSADLSNSEGVAIDLPRMPDPVADKHVAPPAASRTANPSARQPVKR